MAIELHWGILGAGNISGSFAQDLVRNNSLQTEYHHIIESIGSSSITKGEQFIKTHEIIASNNYGVTPIAENYDSFYKNPKINAVYIGTPHVFHHEQTINCLKNKKHVLCEKPFTINAEETKELQALAKEKGLFLMEGVWTRFFPTMLKLQKLIHEDKILGDIKRVFMDFTFDGTDMLPSSRIKDNALGGGALLDIGIYSLTYSRFLLDDKLAPNNTKFELKSFQTIDPSDKVDYGSAFLIKYVNGRQAILSCSIYGDQIPGSPYLRLQGTKGSAQIWAKNPARPELTKIYLKNGETIELKEDPGYNGFIYEANAVAKDISEKKLTSDVVPFEETLLVMEIMDDIRKESGLKYQQDK